MSSVTTRSAEAPPKKKAIVKAARQLLGRYGVKRVTVEEIAKAAGVSKATFYKYFSNKNDLVKSLLTGWSEGGLRRMDEVLHMDLPFTERIRLLVDDKLEQTSAVSDTYIDEIYHLDDPELASFLEQLMADNQRRFVAMITEAQDRGDFRAVDPEFVVAVLGKLNELAADETLRARYPDWTSFTRELVDFFFYGMLTPAQTN